MFKTSLTLSSVIVAAMSGPLLAAETETSLPKLQLAPHLTVSGLSSGGYFAAQFHLAFANEVKGAAILAAAIPSPKAEKASKALSFIRKGLDFLAMNVGNAKNAADAAQPQAKDKQKAN